MKCDTLLITVFFVLDCWPDLAKERVFDVCASLRSDIVYSSSVYKYSVFCMLHHIPSDACHDAYRDLLPICTSL